jgi:hypothetical protein
VDWLRLGDWYRRFVIDGQPVATGVVAVSDAWACTDPSVGRGASIAPVHARVLGDLLRDTDPADHDKFDRRFGSTPARPDPRGELLESLGR